MNLQRILNSRKAGSYALQISQIIPPKMGIIACQWIAKWLAENRELPLTRAIRLNRWVVSGCSANSDELAKAVRANYFEIAYSFYILFHNLNRPEQLQNYVSFSPQAEELIDLSQEKQRGMVVLGLHMSNFDLVMQAAAWKGLHAIGISIPENTENNEAVEWQHKFRRNSGLEILPASFSTFKQAIRRLREGEIVMTGIDRPIPSPRFKPVFFGHPSFLPTHYIHLALEANVPVMLLAATRMPDGIYRIHSTPEIHLNKIQDRNLELSINTAKVLEYAAEFIRSTPDQWDVLQPVWPELLSQMP